MSSELKKILGSPALEAAPALLGWILVRQTPLGVVKLKIVETEAYHQDDPASHSYKWQTARTAPMFEAGGTIYVYFTYGMHYAVNIVTGKAGVGEAVLLRAGEPLEGVDIMKKFRGTTNLHQIANGPGKLAQALGIKDTSLSGTKVGPSTLHLEPPPKPVPIKDILASARIGINQAKDRLWRFYVKDNPFVTKHPYNKKI